MSIKVYYVKGSLPGIQYATTETGDKLITEDSSNLLLDSSYSLNSGNSITPAPLINITPEIYYANDTPIGYTYNISLDGYASAVNYDLSSPLPTGVSDSFNKTLQAVQNIKNLFSFNNGIFAVVGNNNNVLLSASGCIVRNLSFDNNENNWVNYAKYSVDLEANEIQFNSCSGTGQTFGCNSLNIPSGLDNADSPLLLDMTKYKVRSFNDSWSFTASSDNIYQDYSFDPYINLNNQYIEVQYTISANGKNYTRYKSADEVFLIPAWENAKNFCQDRLYTVVRRLINNVLKTPDENSLNNLFANPNNTSGIFYDVSNSSTSIGDSYYGVYNENISCEISESDGSFTATYKSIIKKKNIANDLINSDTLHKIQLSRSVDDDGKNRDVKISVNGEIIGLIEGGLVKSSGLLNFPNNGTILVAYPLASQNSKYQAALDAYNKVADDNGLKSVLASGLDITFDSLNIANSCSLGNNPQAASHSVTHNYNKGSISYQTEYNTKKACQTKSKFTNVTVKIDDPIPRIAEFVVPGKSNGPIIQRIGTDTPRYISVNIEGYDKTYACDYSTPLSLVSDICSYGVQLPNVSGIPALLPEDGVTGLGLVENSFNYNRTDGSFSINRKYIVLDLV